MGLKTENKEKNNEDSSSDDVTKEEKKKADSYVSYFELFRFATCTELVAIFVGIAAAAVNGGCLFWLIAAYGELNTMFVERTVRREFTSTPTTFLKGAGGGVILTNATVEQARDALLDDVKAYGFMMLGHTLATFFSGFITVHLINWAARRQITRIRLRFLESILKQEMEWFDTDANLNFATKMTDDLEKLKEGISEKLGIFMYHAQSSLILIITSFIWGWELTLACLAAVPIAIFVAGGISMLQSKWTVKEQAALSKAGSVAEEVFSAIRTVVAFGGEKKEVDRYKKLLLPVEKFGKWKGILTGAGTGMSWMLMYAVNVIGFVLGVRLVVWGWGEEGVSRYHPGVILTITYNVLMSAQNIALSAPHTEAFAAARGAATDVFRILSRTSKIDSLSTRGKMPKHMRQKLGEVYMDDVHFNYPARPDVRVLRGVTLKVAAGETVALVGASGCGKSTVLQLLQRLYDPILGVVNVHGINVKEANLAALRKLNGVVGQEPVLFTGTVRENITCGVEYSSKEVEEAALVANAHGFITRLPDGYDTVLGARGSSLSGGQKQRIAIARAVIRKPSLLLLDEPTSALDHRAEQNVQAALEKARQGRTTIVVSHRLSTIVNSSRIVCMDAGKVVEEGTHEELMEKKGFYHKLVTTTSEIKPLEASPPGDQNDDDNVEDPKPEAVGIQRKVSHRRSSRRVHRSSSIRRESVAWSRRTSAVSLASNIEYPHVESGLLDDDELGDDEEKEEKMSEWQFLKLSAPEWPLIAVGSVAALLQGGSFPAFSILFSYVFGLFSLRDPAEIISQADHYSGLLFLGSVCAGVTMFVQSTALTYAGARLTTRLRVEAFTNYLRQEMSFFDDSRNTVGALCSRLGGDAGCLAGAAGARLGLVLLGGSALLTGAVLAASHEYRMALVGLCFVPPIVVGMWAEGRASRTAADRERECMDAATDIATEAIRAIRTVHSLGTEDWVLARYSKAVLDGAAASASRGRWRGVVYGAGLASPCLCYNVSLIYGGVLIANNEMSYQKALLVVEALMNGAFMLGQALVFAPNFARARDSAAAVMAHIRRLPTLTSYRGLHDNPKWKSTGVIDMKNLDFAYPTRAQHPVLRDLSLKVDSGSRVALVGASGCGKSTLVQLLLRFYDPDSGAIHLDRRELRRCVTLTSLRQQFGLVQQEPVLFDRSIGENIAYGACDRRVTTAQVVAAAKAANIHSFIVSLPRGYETGLGAGGASLSGGQKQRVAIARALLREPALLLLDEATSALDVASEKAVSEALRAASAGRTTVVVAHRLTTVQDADLICVIHKGQIAECGTHDELLRRGGLYHNMYQTQAIAA